MSDTSRWLKGKKIFDRSGLRVYRDGLACRIYEIDEYVQWWRWPECYIEKRALALANKVAPAPRGNCYVCVEALYRLLGGKKSGWVPHTVRHEGDVHWYLVNVDVILDPTASQFKNPPPYHLGRGRGFLTKRPSKRARELMKRMLWQE